MAVEIRSLAELVRILAEAPKNAWGERGDFFYTPIEFTSLTLRESSSTDHKWACVSVGAVTINGKLYNINGPDAHISIGTWLNTGPDAKWSRQVVRAKAVLARVPKIDFQMVANEEVCDNAHSVFNFAVNSTGGQMLTSLQQILSACRLKSALWQPRGMSPPGPIFHLSVYDVNIEPNV